MSTTNQFRRALPLNKSTLLIASALCMAYSPVYAAGSPFAPVPLHLDNTTSSAAPPNVLLLIDNSGSMLGIPEDSNIFPDAATCRTYVSLYPVYDGQRYRLSESDAYYACGQRPSSSPRFYAYYSSWQPLYVCGDAPTAAHATCTTGPALSRIQITRNVINSLVNNPDNSKVRWGLTYLNYTSFNKATDVDIDGPSVANQNSIRTSINNVVAYSGTPTTQRYLQAVQSKYLNSSSAIKYRCQKNYVVVMSDGEANGAAFTLANDQFFRQGAPTYSNGISYNTWTSDQNGGPGLEYLSSQVYNQDLKTGGNDQDTPSGNWDDPKFNEGKQNISTFTIGFGLSNAYLSRGAQGEGKALSANSASQLQSAFEEALNSITNANQGYSAITPAISVSSTGNVATVVTLDTGNWSSEFRFLKLVRNAQGNLVAERDANGNLVYLNAAYGTLTNNLQTATRRVIASTPTLAPHFLSASTFGNSDTPGKPTRQQYIDWTIRNSSLSDTTINPAFKERSSTKSASDLARQMGDVVDSSILQMGASKNTPAGPKPEFLLTAANDGMVHMLRVRENDSTRPYELKLNYMPTAATREDDNDTIWARLPDTMAPQYGKNSRNPHHFLVNGGIAYRQTYNGHIFVVGALGQGGKGIYALNVGGNNHTDPSQKTPLALSQSSQSQWLSEVPLWETANMQFGANKTDITTATENKKLGYTLGMPVIGRVASERSADGKPILTQPIRYAAFVANGYFGQDTVPSLYVYDALGVSMTFDANGTEQTPTRTANQAGKLLKKISIPTTYTSNTGSISIATNNGSKTTNNALSSPTAVDVNMDGIVDIAYAGDLRGNLYRFDLRGTDSSAWKAVRIYRGSPNEPITAAPAIYKRPDNTYVVIFGTGRDLYTSDLSDKSQQTLYGIFDDVNKTPLEAPAVCTSDTTKQYEAAFCDRDTGTKQLTAQSLQAAQTGQDTTLNNRELRYISNNSNAADAKGWYLPLSTTTGERIVVKPSVIDNAAFVSTRIYIQDTSNQAQVCSQTASSGESWLMGVNVDNGGSLTAKTTNFTSTANRNNPLAYYSGIKVDGIASATTFVRNANNSTFRSSGLGDAVTMDGDTGSGRETKVGENDGTGTNAQSTCGASSSSGSNSNPPSSSGSGPMTMGSIGDIATGISGQTTPNSDPTDTNSLYEKMMDSCRVKRISWREIF